MAEKKEMMTEEVAEAEFERWAEENDIDFSDVANEPETIAMKKKLVKAFIKGRLVAGANGTLKFTTSSHNEENFANQEIICKQPASKSYLTSGNAKTGDTHRTFEIIAAMTGKDVSFLSRLVISDFNILMAVAYFFIIA